MSQAVGSFSGFHIDGTRGNTIASLKIGSQPIGYLANGALFLRMGSILLCPNRAIRCIFAHRVKVIKGDFYKKQNVPRMCCIPSRIVVAPQHAAVAGVEGESRTKRRQFY
jgi:hypothetical protein